MSYAADVREALEKLWQLRPFTERELELIRLAFVVEESTEDILDRHAAQSRTDAGRMFRMIQTGAGTEDFPSEDSDTNGGGE